MSDLAERIAAVLDRAQVFGGPESLNSDNLADAIIETLGLTQEFAVCFEDDAQVWLIGDRRYLNHVVAAQDLPDQPSQIHAFVGTNWATRWERSDG